MGAAFEGAWPGNQRERQGIAEAHGADGHFGMGDGSGFGGHGFLDAGTMAGALRSVNALPGRDNFNLFISILRYWFF
jgi:hypothetical protein